VFFFSVVGVLAGRSSSLRFFFSLLGLKESEERKRYHLTLYIVFSSPSFSYYTTHIRNGFYNLESLLFIEVPKMCVCVCVCVCVCQLTEFENDGSFEMFLLVESNVFILLKLVSQFASFYTYEM
jgi:hypothetical protein